MCKSNYFSIYMIYNFDILLRFYICLEYHTREFTYITVLGHSCLFYLISAGPRTSSRDVFFSKCRLTDEANHFSLSLFDELMMRFDTMTRELKREINSLKLHVRANSDCLSQNSVIIERRIAGSISYEGR